MKMRNVELYLQKKFDKSFAFEDNRDKAIDLVHLKKDLSEARVALVSSGGLYDKDDKAFDTEARLGDTSYRAISKDVNLQDLKIAHTHYDHGSALEDMNVVMPLDALKALKDEGTIGSLSDTHYSFSGFILDTETFKSQIPKMMVQMKKEGVDVVVLAPA